MKKIHNDNITGSCGYLHESFLFPCEIIKGRGAADTVIPDSRGSAVIADSFVTRQFASAFTVNENVLKVLFSGDMNPAEFFRVKNVILESRVKEVIGMGGGKCMDLCKLIKRDLPEVKLILIPTSAATCASCTPVSVMYDKQGVYQNTMDSALPDKLIIDYTFFDTLPMGFFAAGLADAMCKYFEATEATGPAENIPLQDAIVLSMGAVSTAVIFNKLAVKFQNADNAMKEEMADLNIIHSGMMSCMGRYSGTSYAAHAFAHAMTVSKGAREFLHGEHAAMGLLFQETVLDKKRDAEIKDIFSGFDLPLKLSAFNIKEDEIDAVVDKYRKIEAADKINLQISNKLMYNIIKKLY
ncbi:MAG: iron-containing alcohol dehydrogenase [Candidatus Goldbacteria bacterium]|nr:iron-containing alcohol dehydrogenase [Candidatus Goldiibacteriota bacterium]